MIVAVDVDGTLLDDNEEWIPGAEAALRWLARHNEVVIHSCRANWQGGRAALYELLREVRLNRHVKIHVAEGKPRADVYIDDKALRFTGDWNETLQALNAL